jgi:uncharacterized protein with von Willebrand factor type A (vWA) domain
MTSVAKLDKNITGGMTNYTDALRQALDMLVRVPDTYGKHIYFVADGMDNVKRDGLDAQIERARRMRVRIYAIPIGCTAARHTFNLKRLYDMAHNTDGNVKAVSRIKELAEHFTGLAARGGRNLGQSVAKVIIVDTSGSMAEPWDRGTKIEALRTVLFRFLSVESKRQ